jgi:DNA polymerase
MPWSILTPDRSVCWDTRELTYGPGVPRSHAPQDDELEDLWRAYYASTFNPARTNPDLLRVHMPERRWSTLPEAQVICDLVRGSESRQQSMLSTRPLSAASFIPEHATLPVLRQAVHSCRGCDLWEHATQPVFGEGPHEARIVIVGEQPGDNEDRDGRPFVGPSGQLFDRALAQAGLNRADLYVTGAVKHFRFEERGKRRIHKTASKTQVAACQPWLERELQLISPQVIVCMGNTAALSVIGRGVRLQEERGRILPHRFAAGVLVTVHPGFLLRMPDEDRREDEFRRFVDDIRSAREFADRQRTPPLPNRLDLASFAKCS